MDLVFGFVWLLATRAWPSWLVALGTFLPWGGRGNVLQFFAAGTATTLTETGYHVARGRLSCFTSKLGNPALRAGNRTRHVQ